ncbi:DUF4179 domain-containing protein [Alkalihalobacterium chitinilyticum]|uniref:DUF4179 domain-containing protein n=1 Tax=Alkalihalobacterium chitinilyticum TaxID=2980103 RepID=A0ABT5VMW1_9BACI|nr:DUF4179 domain-containing protein [Alkalihalobacterium chitinilyticum]MDE5415604.1 DUF4179 domain-containing protein [Alkalihalobacterium chitinilyticum]
MNDLDKQLSERLRQNVKEPPASVVERMNKTLNSLPERKERAPKNYKVMFGVVAAFFLMVIISMPMFQSVVPQGVQEDSLQERIFQLVGEAGLEQLSKEGLTFPMNLSATSNDITIEITEAMFDGTRLYFGFIETHSEPIDLVAVSEEDLAFKESRFFVGDRGDYYHMLGGKPTRQLSETKVAGVFGSSFVGDVNQLENINITVYRGGEYAGEWEFLIDEIPVIEGVSSFSVDEMYLVDEQYEFYIEKVIQTPVTIEVYYSFDYALNSSTKETHDYYEMTVRDLEGEPYEGIYIGDIDQNRLYRVLTNGQDKGIRLQYNKFLIANENDVDTVQIQKLNEEAVLDVIIELDDE